MNRRNKVDISAIMTAHWEGVLAGLSLKSMIDAVEHVRHASINVEVIVVLDRPDGVTKQFVESVGLEDLAVFYTDFGDQGKVRNYAIEKSCGKYVAFLDGDDLWSFNWLSSALESMHKYSDEAIVHPEFNWFFDKSSGVLEKVDMSDVFFDDEYLRVMNYWDALCFAPKHIHEIFPYSARDIAGGFAYEDWHWNCLTLANGYRHVIAPDTIHFKRRRAGSQTIEASTRRALPGMNSLFDYSSYQR